MYLSRIELDTGRDKTLKAIATPAMIHAAIEGCFPKREDGKERKLWRLDTLGGKHYLLLLSPDRPDFKGFCAQFCKDEASGETKDYAPLLSHIEAGQKWRFRLRANPTYSSASSDGKRGKLFVHTTPIHQRGWLQKKAAQFGFSLEEGFFDTVQNDPMKFRRDQKEVTIAAVVFEGELTVTDAAQFRNALTGGIGRAKAYGCGLLTVAPLS